MFIVQGDAFHCTWGIWSHLGITLANHGARTCQPAYYLVTVMAVCGDKDMTKLGAIWRDNLQVWLPRTHSYFVSPSSRSNLNFQRSKKRSKTGRIAQVLFF